MSSASEIVVVMKDEEKTLRNKFLIYEDYTVDIQDPVIMRCVNETQKIFGNEPIDIQIKITLVIQ